MSKLPVHPETPPIWLGDWPKREDVTRMFSEGMRRYAFRVLRDAGVVTLDWDDQHLVLDLGQQKATWTLAGADWRTGCTCGYPNGRCAHAYAAARVFQQVLESENWLHRGGPTPKNKPEPTGAWRRRIKTRAVPLEQLPLFGAVVPAPAEVIPARLEAEVELHYAPDRVALRFYLTENDRRRLLRTQQLLNLALAARHSSSGRRRWSDEDREFLDWLAVQLRRDRQVRANLQVLKISQGDFRYWLEHWDEQPGRFIERATQEPITRGPRAARLHFELENEGEWVRIHAVVRAPNGLRRRFHEVFDDLASGRKQMLVDGRLLDFEPPIPMELLFEVFGKRSPRMRRAHVRKHLPALLKYRLDLVRGRNVTRRDRPGRLRILAGADGAGIRLRLFIGAVPVRPGSNAASGEILVEGDGFCIVRNTCADLAPTQRALAKLKLEPQPDGAFFLPATAENVAGLARVWRKLPDGVERECAPELAGVLGGDPPLRPELQLVDHDAYVDMTVIWGNGEIAVANAEARAALRSETGIFRSRSGRWLRLDTEAAAAAWTGLGAVGFDADRTQRVFRPQARELLRRLSEQDALLPESAGVPLADRLLREPPARPLPIPPELEPVLRPYQREGVRFLADRIAHRIGPVLADDMGLGKTLQVLALLSSWFRREPVDPGGPGGAPPDRGALVVCPASVVSVWLEQAEKFTPELRCVAYAGAPPVRRAVLDKTDWDVLVANYALVRNDAAALAGHTFAFVVLDEAQQIKNPDAQVSRAVRALRTPHPLALTGTPLENRLTDLWSVMEFLNPGFLNSREEFLARHDSPRGHRDLAKRLAPVLLRRDKRSVAPELPPRTDETLRIDLSEEQAALYATELARARRAAREQGPMQILAALTRLRQVCCHPRLLRGHEEVKTPSAKLDVLLDMLEELRTEGHSVLVFSQFTSMLALIEEALRTAGAPFLKLTGETPTARRAELVREFNEAPEPHVFLLSLRAAGTGLNLTRAEYVFIYDPWWNPAVERQAVDRAHRIGQERHVIAYRLVARDTVEEKIVELQRKKGELFDEVVDGAARAGGPARLTAKDLAALLS
ncbi:MAG: DEAD/DEAH box helicase [Kiritimatiellaeota bacterium]|nr:DEAD/DEAH box helicase [Kiritimatiellota bacterium]